MKLKYDVPLSNFALKSNLRRYSKEYGALIDAHDAVIRINVLDNANAKFFANLGAETTYRVLSYKMSKAGAHTRPLFSST